MTDLYPSSLCIPYLTPGPWRLDLRSFTCKISVMDPNYFLRHYQNKGIYESKVQFHAFLFLSSFVYIFCIVNFKTCRKQQTSPLPKEGNFGGKVWYKTRLERTTQGWVPAARVKDLQRDLRIK